jgi:hypothetical protein
MAVRDDILGMLRTAVQRGKNLQQTVQSLYNSGYAKNEVDDAVQALNSSGFSQPAMPVNVPKQKPAPAPPAPAGQTQQIVSAYPSSLPQPMQYPQPAPAAYAPQQFYQPQPFYSQYVQSPQLVSSYEQKPKAGKLMIIVMIAMLIVLVGILVVVFLYKDQLTNFINNL